ncbi:uncharacterized protein LOC133836963 [Drosophila sulfurigaster albostrigata]|uniref:uncharacterized protein LOC133836963 n=1 Tax=Drosophila sulfurigaster albostrigata TaxID=89887 RepID=UPI002D2195B0|nr:uncharacterized protein LOC133836963 [Drosophila sulfurigaster albostrigata]
MLYRRLWLIVLTFEFATSSHHYHRYMLSDYKPQHSHKTQKDYRPVPRSVDAPLKDVTKRNALAKPMVNLAHSNKKVPLETVMVRVYEHRKVQLIAWPIAAAALIGIIVIVTKGGPIIYKSPTNETLEVDYEHTDWRQPLLKTVYLNNSSNHMNSAIQICNTVLRPDDHVSLIAFSHRSQTLYSKESIVLSPSECREKLNDPSGKIVTPEVICARNERRTKKCEPNLGLPLMFNDQLCGLQILGHNCPKYYGVDLYARVLNRKAYKKATLKRMAAKIEDAMP